MECINENDAGINYEGDEIDNNDNNDNKSSFHDYHLSQYIASQTSNTSLTQLSETSLSNIRTNLDFVSISIMSQKRNFVDFIPYMAFDRLVSLSCVKEVFDVCEEIYWER